MVMGGMMAAAVALVAVLLLVPPPIPHSGGTALLSWGAASVRHAAIVRTIDMCYQKIIKVSISCGTHAHAPRLLCPALRPLHTQAVQRNSTAAQRPLPAAPDACTLDMRKRMSWGVATASYQVSTQLLEHSSQPASYPLQERPLLVRGARCVAVLCFHVTVHRHLCVCALYVWLCVIFPCVCASYACM